MKFLYIILLIAAAIFYPMYQDNLSFMLLLSMLILPVILLICLILSIIFLKVKVTADNETTEHGKPVKLRIRIINNMILPISCCNIIIKYKDENGKIQKHSTAIPLAARSSESVIFSINSKHCGIIDCTVDKVRISDFIGLFSIPKKVNFRVLMPVLPVIYPFETSIINNMNIDDESDVFSEFKAGDNPSEVFDLRDYHDGDNLNRIHWKLSSRTDDFIVKELSEPVSSSVLMLPDLLSCRSGKESDDVLDLYATLSNFLVKKRLSHTVLSYDNEIALNNISNKDELSALLERQVKTLSEPKPDTTLLLESLNIMSSMTRYSHIICIVSRDSMDVLHEIEMMSIAERISVICVGCEQNDTESKLSEIVVYHTTVDSFYEDLRIFEI